MGAAGGVEASASGQGASAGAGGEQGRSSQPRHPRQPANNTGSCASNRYAPGLTFDSTSPRRSVASSRRPPSLRRHRARRNLISAFDRLPRRRGALYSASNSFTGVARFDCRGSNRVIGTRLIDARFTQKSSKTASLDGGLTLRRARRRPSSSKKDWPVAMATAGGRISMCFPCSLVPLAVYFFLVSGAIALPRSPLCVALRSVRKRGEERRASLSTHGPAPFVMIGVREVRSASRVPAARSATRAARRTTSRDLFSEWGTVIVGR